MTRFAVDITAVILSGILFCFIPEDLLQYQAAMYMVVYYIVIRGGMGIVAEIYCWIRKENRKPVKRKEAA